MINFHDAAYLVDYSVKRVSRFPVNCPMPHCLFSPRSNFVNGNRDHQEVLFHLNFDHRRPGEEWTLRLLTDGLDTFLLAVSSPKPFKQPTKPARGVKRKKTKVSGKRD